MSNTPSDEEILALAQQHLKAFAQFSLGEVWFEGEVEFARAVLAKWGSPQPVVREPLTHDEALDAFCHTPGIYQFVQAFMAGVRFAEQAHGITQKGGD